jgi:hypothetical protein
VRLTFGADFHTSSTSFLEQCFELRCSLIRVLYSEIVR